MKKPYMKFYGRDWLGDPALRMVSPSARGVWIDLLCTMSMATPYGHLSVNGSPMTDEQAARICGLTLAEFAPILATIEAAGISSRTDTGMLYSRRLVRDYDAYQTAADSGRRGGGSPALRALHTPPDGEENTEAKSQKPEATLRLKVPIKEPIKVPLKVEKHSTAAVSFEDLPPWLRTAPGMDSGIWAAWIDTRRRKRAAVGGSAIALCLRKLQARPDKAVSYLQLAIERGWQGVSWDWFDAAAQGQTGVRNGYQRPDPEDVTPEVAASRARRKQVFEVYLSAVKSAGRIPTKMELASLRAVNGAIPDDEWRSGCEWARNSSEFREIVQGHEQTNHGE